MDALVLQTAQEQLLGSPVTEHDYEYGHNSNNTYPPNTIVPTQPVQPHFVVEQSEHEEAVVLLQEDTSTHSTTVVDAHPSADFPMFAFDLADLPTFDLESNNHTPTPVTHQAVATISTTIPLADEFTPTMVNNHATTAFTVPEQHTVAPPAGNIPVQSNTSTTPTTAPAIETNWQELTQQLEALNNTSSVTQSPAMATSPSPSIANTAAIPAVAPAPTPIAQEVPHHNHHAASLHKLSVGLRVHHQEYGLGTVQAVVPLEDRNVASILFDTHGRKLLDPALSALYPA
jgi:hypothetical protein